MDVMMKGFLGVFIFALITYIAAGTISAEMDSCCKKLYGRCQKEIAEANMAASVIDAVGNQAAEGRIQDDDHHFWRWK